MTRPTVLASNRSPARASAAPESLSRLAFAVSGLFPGWRVKKGSWTQKKAGAVFNPGFAKDTNIV